MTSAGTHLVIVRPVWINNKLGGGKYIALDRISQSEITGDNYDNFSLFPLRQLKVRAGCIFLKERRTMKSFLSH